MRGCEFDVEIIADEDAFVRLKPEWDALYERAAAPPLSLSFDWCRCVWEIIARPAGSRLFCLAVRRAGRLVLVLPLVIGRRRRFWTVATALATPEDYADVLTEPGHDRRALAAFVWRALRAHCPSDFIRLERVRATSLLRDVLAAAGGKTIETQPAPYTAWHGHADWQSYWTSRSKNFRSNFARRSRQLGALGTVSVDMAVTGARCREAIVWMFRRKEEWRERKGIAYSSSIGVPRYEQFLLEMADKPSLFGRVAAFSLLVDGKIVATQINIVASGVMESRHVAYDNEYYRYSPSTILDVYALEWAFEQNLIFDFGVGEGDHKTQFMTQASHVGTDNVHLTAWSRAYEGLRLLSAASLGWPAWARRRGKAKTEQGKGSAAQGLVTSWLCSALAQDLSLLAVM